MVPAEPPPDWPAPPVWSPDHQGKHSDSEAFLPSASSDSPSPTEVKCGARPSTGEREVRHGVRKMKDCGLIFSADYQTGEEVQLILSQSLMYIFLCVFMTLNDVLCTHFSCQNEHKSAKTNPSLRPGEDDGVVRLSGFIAQQPLWSQRARYLLSHQPSHPPPPATHHHVNKVTHCPLLPSLV